MTNEIILLEDSWLHEYIIHINKNVRKMTNIILRGAITNVIMLLDDS